MNKFILINKILVVNDMNKQFNLTDYVLDCLDRKAELEASRLSKISVPSKNSFTRKGNVLVTNNTK